MALVRQEAGYAVGVAAPDRADPAIGVAGVALPVGYRCALFDPNYLGESASKFEERLKDAERCGVYLRLQHPVERDAGSCEGNVWMLR